MSASHRRQARVAVLRRTLQVFAFFWRQRHALDAPARNRLEAEFMPAALALQSQPVSPVGRLVGRVLMLLLALLLVWAVFGRVDIAINATGKVVPSARTKSIASVEIASVRAIHVTDGQRVKAGDPLIDLDATETDSEHDKAAELHAQAELQVARASALIAAIDNGRPPAMAPMADVPPADVPPAEWAAERAHLAGQYRDYLAKLRRIDADIRRCEEALPLAAQQAVDYQALAADHDVAPHAYLQKEQARVDLDGQLRQALAQREELIADTRKTAYDAIADGRKQADETREDARRAGSHSQRLQLTAPVDGTVQQLAVHTVGGVVPAAQPLMQIVPQEQAVEVEATVENKDIGFVREGQAAAVKVDAFEYTKYGTVGARVERIARDAVNDEKRGLLYTVGVTLDRAALAVDGRSVALSPGLSVSVEIKTGSRRIIEYVLSPLLQHGSESFHER